MNDVRCEATCEDRHCSERDLYADGGGKIPHDGPHRDAALLWTGTHFWWRHDEGKQHERRCDWCAWPLKETTRDGCTAGNCSQRPRPKKREPWDCYGGTHLPKLHVPPKMSAALALILDVSARIREYEAAADTMTAMARLCTDVQVRASLQQLAHELVQTAGQWRVRQDADLVATRPSAEDPSSKRRSDEYVVNRPEPGPPGGSYAKHIKAGGGGVPLPPTLKFIDDGADRVAAGEGLASVILGSDPDDGLGEGPSFAELVPPLGWGSK